MKSGAPTPPEMARWLIVLTTGWTLEQVDALSENDYREFFCIRDGMLKAGTWRNV